MGLNPFVFDSPLPPEHLIGRTAEWRKLVELAEAGHNARLSAPRRYGKTTLLRKVAVEANRLGMATVYVDLFGVVSADDVAVRIERAYYESLKGPLARWFLSAQRRWRPSARLRTPVAEVGVEAGSVDDAPRALHELLDLPKSLFEQSGKRSLVIFDEFQDLLAAGSALDGLMRSRIQHHHDEASYIFAGSHPGLMAELFGSRKRPLYDQARPVHLDPLSDDELAAYVGIQFEETARDVAPSIEPFLDLVRGHPQRSMLIAHHLWERTPRGGAADDERWTTALRSVFADLQEGFERAWDDYSAAQRRVLAALAWGGQWGEGRSLYSAETLTRFGLSKGTTRTVLGLLRRRGDVEPSGSAAPRLIDPLFELWIAAGRRQPFASEQSP